MTPRSRWCLSGGFPAHSWKKGRAAEEYRFLYRSFGGFSVKIGWGLIVWQKVLQAFISGAIPNLHIGTSRLYGFQEGGKGSDACLDEILTLSVLKR